jgi:hypothetical protein
MSLTSFLFEGKPPKSTTTYGTTTATMPDWYTDYQKSVLAKGNAISSEPFQKYNAPRVAGLTDFQNQAYSNVAANQGSWMPGLAQGAAMTQGSTGFNQAEFDQWKSPAIEGVVNRIAQLGSRNLSENLLPQVNAAFIRGNNAGSLRHGDFTQRAVRDANESIMGQQALALQQANDSAMSNYQQDKSRQLAAGDQMAALAQMRQQLGIQDASALEAAGQAIQGQNQKNLDIGYQDFVEQRDAPKNNLAFLSQLLGNTAVPQSTSTSNYGPSSVYQPSGLAQMAGIYSLFKGMKKGGAVRTGSSHRNTGGMPGPRRIGYSVRGSTMADVVRSMAHAA